VLVADRLVADRLEPPRLAAAATGAPRLFAFFDEFFAHAPLFTIHDVQAAFTWFFVTS